MEIYLLMKNDWLTVHTNYVYLTAKNLIHYFLGLMCKTKRNEIKRPLVQRRETHVAGATSTMLTQYVYYTERH